MFVFDRDYNNDAQVEEWLPEFVVLHDEITGAGKYAYNDSFKGLIEGIAGPDEDTAIYLLQGLRRKRLQEEKVAALLADGYKVIESADGSRYAHICLVPVRRMGGEWNEFRDARLIADSRRGDSAPYGVLPKGKRTHGVLVMGRMVVAA